VLLPPFRDSCPLACPSTQGLKCPVYLDDIMFGENLKVHNERLRDVFARLRSYNLKLQSDKCEFLRKEVLYLGHRLTCKVWYMMNQNEVQLRNFLFLNYKET
jgi:hypothetical protein